MDATEEEAQGEVTRGSLENQVKDWEDHAREGLCPERVAEGSAPYVSVLRR